MYHRILVPLDGSPLAEAALPHAIEIARGTGASISLLQVASVMPVATSIDPMTSSGLDASIAMEVLEANEESAAKYLDEVAHRPEMAGVPVQTEVVRGTPAMEIVRKAKTGDVDLIAMSTHGRSGLSRLVFGSVADQVLREAGMPILLIRPQEE